MEETDSFLPLKRLPLPICQQSMVVCKLQETDILTFNLKKMAKTAPKPKPQPKPNPQWPSTNPGKKSGPDRGNNSPKK